MVFAARTAFYNAAFTIWALQITENKYPDKDKNEFTPKKIKMKKLIFIQIK